MANDIDFERALMLMDVIAKVTTTLPSYTGLISAAGVELREIEDAALENQKELAEERLQAEKNAIPPRETNLQSAEEVEGDEEINEDESTDTGRRA